MNSVHILDDESYLLLSPPHTRRPDRERPFSLSSTLSDQSSASGDSYLNPDSTCSLKRQPHIRRLRKQRVRPLPPRPLLWVEPPSVPTQKIRKLPVIPLPMSPFPSIPPSCPTPAPRQKATVPYHMPQQEIDWDEIDAILCDAP